ncbi:MAG: DinB family protein, partial [Candidatus Thorarchaeota archaeon]
QNIKLTSDSKSLIIMEVLDLIKSLAAATRAWRENTLQELQAEGCDLSYRPGTGMSAFGWILAHQAAAYDYILNMLIKGNEPKNPDLFYQYRGDSTDPGDWTGTSLEEIEDYYDSVEQDFLTYFGKASKEELSRTLDGNDIPQYFLGMSVIDAIADMFAHMNHHNGHLSAIRRDWCSKEKE